MNSASDHWQAVELSRNLHSKPVRVYLDGRPIVLFRTTKGVEALVDRCPHRLVELSKGRVVGDDIECPYHGWRFSGKGLCTTIPCNLGSLPSYKVKSFAVAERGGVIFVADNVPLCQPYLHCMEGKDVIVCQVKSKTTSTLIDAAENILDATHTHFTHKGLLRGLSSKRYIVNVKVTGGAGWIEASYTGEEKQQGLVSRLLTRKSTRTVGRFIHPGITELEYWSGDTLVLATTFHLRQVAADSVEGIGLLVGQRYGGLGHLKAILFKPLFNLALQQDRRILKSASDNEKLFPSATPIIGPLDFLRKDIELIMRSELPSASALPILHQIEL
jgi:phenylpropionate dioxygenase-like ring-hydroxylating dioxygenase large terminal subunit